MEKRKIIKLFFLIYIILTSFYTDAAQNSLNTDKIGIKKGEVYDLIVTDVIGIRYLYPYKDRYLEIGDIFFSIEVLNINDKKGFVTINESTELQNFSSQFQLINSSLDDYGNYIIYTDWAYWAYTITSAQNYYWVPDYYIVQQEKIINTDKYFGTNLTLNDQINTPAYNLSVTHSYERVYAKSTGMLYRHYDVDKYDYLNGTIITNLLKLETKFRNPIIKLQPIETKYIVYSAILIIIILTFILKKLLVYK